MPAAEERALGKGDSNKTVHVVTVDHLVAPTNLPEQPLARDTGADSAGVSPHGNMGEVSDTVRG